MIYRFISHQTFQSIGQVLIVRGIDNFDFCFTYLCSFSGENIAVLGPATKLPLWAYDAATRPYLHPRISINIHPHVTRCAIMHFFTAYSPKWVFLCCIPTFFNFVCGRWFSRCEKENSKLPLTLTLKYIYSTSGLVDNGNRFNWFRTIQNYTGLWATSTSSEPVCHEYIEIISTVS